MFRGVSAFIVALKKKIFFSFVKEQLGIGEEKILSLSVELCRDLFEICKLNQSQCEESLSYKPENNDIEY